MFEVQIPQKYKFTTTGLFEMIDTTLGTVYPKTIDSKNVLTIDATLTATKKQALKTAFLSMASEYTDLTV